MEVVVGLDLDIDSVLDDITVQLDKCTRFPHSVLQYNHLRGHVPNTPTAGGVLIRGSVFPPEPVIDEQVASSCREKTPKRSPRVVLLTSSPWF